MAFFIGVFGWIGSAAVILAYGLISYNKLQSNSLAYQALNFGGSLCLIMNTAYYGAYPSTVVNVVWAVIAMLTLVRISGRRATTDSRRPPTF